MGYIALGQSSTTLSKRGAANKITTELKERYRKYLIYFRRTYYWIAFEDIRVLLEVLNHLTEKGNTVLIIEHNLDVIKQVDHIIDIGPEG